MPVEFALKDLAAKYDRFARWYNCFEDILGFFGVSRLRQAIVSKTSGRIFEVAVGTGKNLDYYSRDCRIIAVDVSAEMLKLAREREGRLNVYVQFCLADAEALPFADGCFDTVVSTLRTCTFPNPADALKEMRRVCKPAGQILLLKHGRSDRGWLGQWQDRHAAVNYWSFLKNVGFQITASHRSFFRTFHRIEAEPDA